MGFERPSSAEDEFIKREESARRQREALEKAHAMNGSEKEHLQNLHSMKCPKCGFDLHEVPLRNIKVDVCEHCRGIWLDEAELEHVVSEPDSGWLKSLQRFVTGK